MTPPVTPNDLSELLSQRAKTFKIPHTIWTLLVDDGELLLLGSDDEDSIGPVLFFSEDWMTQVADSNKLNGIECHPLQVSGKPEDILRFFVNFCVKSGCTEINFHLHDGSVNVVKLLLSP